MMFFRADEMDHIIEHRIMESVGNLFDCVTMHSLHGKCVVMWKMRDASQASAASHSLNTLFAFDQLVLRAILDCIVLTPKKLHNDYRIDWIQFIPEITLAPNHTLGAAEKAVCVQELTALELFLKKYNDANGDP